MAQSEFNAPVLVALGPDRTVRIVSNAAEAIACLSSIYWPKAGKQCWREARVEGGKAFLGVHVAKSVKGVAVVPWWPMLVGCASADLRHQSRLDNPYGVGNQSGAPASS